MIAPSYSIDPYVLDPLMRDLVGHDHRPSSYLVFLALSASAAGSGTTSISLSELAEQTGLSKRGVHSAVQHLLGRGLLEAKKRAATEIPRYRPLAPWRDDGASALTLVKPQHSKSG
jgi:DNA-binding transcriptional MocR family regulator